MTTSIAPTFSTLSIEIQNHVAWLRLNRPDKGNALSLPMWEELPQALNWIDRQSPVRVLILAGAGKHFCAGIDLAILQHYRDGIAGGSCAARSRESFYDFIERAQAAFNAFEKLKVPVIAAVHGACIGGGVDLIAACDLRLSTADARFCVKEVDVAIVPDVGTIQRLRHVIGYSQVAELTYTAEMFDGHRAEKLGLVSRICETPEQLFAQAQQLAETIAAKPPVAVRGIKRNLLYSRDHSVADGLAYAAVWNAGFTVGSDLDEAMAAQQERRAPEYRD